VPAGELTGAGATVVLSGAEARHAAVVRRLRAGERADLSDGAGTLASGVVITVGPQEVAVAVRSVMPVAVPSPRITVIQALAKGDRGELAVEMMSEVGVDAVVAWPAERSVVRWEGTRGERSLAKWGAVAREAAKQSRRAWMPAVTGPASLAEVAAAVSSAACAVVLEPGAAVPLSRLALPVAGEIVLVVGPEGGISAKERSALAAAGATEARLGPTVLRTSTAGAAAAAVLLSRTGRW
jgi:16S rRNA (uracil1498-N3)-methyltransferase